MPVFGKGNKDKETPPPPPPPEKAPPPKASAESKKTPAPTAAPSKASSNRPTSVAAAPAQAATVAPITPQIEAEQKKLFELLGGSDKKGVIEVTDAKTAIASQGFPIDDQQWTAACKKLGVKEQISFQDYMKLYQQCTAGGKLAAAQVLSAFKLLAPHNGPISQDYLHRILSSTGNRIPDMDVVQIMETGQMTRPNRTIHYEDWVKKTFSA